MLISLMQLSSALGTEIINIALICAQDTVKDVIMNFIALGVIAEIDNFYAGTLTNNPIKNQIGDVALDFESEEDEAGDRIKVVKNLAKT